MSGNLKRAKQAPIKLRSLVQGFIRHNQMLHKLTNIAILITYITINYSWIYEYFSIAKGNLIISQCQKIVRNINQSQINNIVEGNMIIHSQSGFKVNSTLQVNHTHNLMYYMKAFIVSTDATVRYRCSFVGAWCGYFNLHPVWRKLIEAEHAVHCVNPGEWEFTSIYWTILKFIGVLVVNCMSCEKVDVEEFDLDLQIGVDVAKFFGTQNSTTLFIL